MSFKVRQIISIRSFFRFFYFSWKILRVVFSFLQRGRKKNSKSILIVRINIRRRNRTKKEGYRPLAADESTATFCPASGSRSLRAAPEAFRPRHACFNYATRPPLGSSMHRTHELSGGYIVGKSFDTWQSRRELIFWISLSPLTYFTRGTGLRPAKQLCINEVPARNSRCAVSSSSSSFFSPLPLPSRLVIIPPLLFDPPDNINFLFDEYG